MILVFKKVYFKSAVVYQADVIKIYDITRSYDKNEFRFCVVANDFIDAVVWVFHVYG
ncbi:hypothetical protein D3C85_1648310 [compost metagenome]